MCYAKCPHEDSSGCCREEECVFWKNGLDAPTERPGLLKGYKTPEALQK